MIEEYTEAVSLSFVCLCTETEDGPWLDFEYKSKEEGNVHMKTERDAVLMGNASVHVASDDKLIVFASCQRLDECEEGQGLRFSSRRAGRDIVVPLVLEEAVRSGMHLVVFRASTRGAVR